MIAEREQQLLLELKKIALEPVHIAKVIAYLRVTDIKLGILVSFGGRRVDYQKSLIVLASVSFRQAAQPLLRLWRR